MPRTQAPGHRPTDDVIGGNLLKPLRERTANHWRAAAKRAQLRGNVAAALQCWLQVRQVQPRALDVLFHIACCHALLDEPGRACVMLYALAEHPDTPAPLRERAERLAQALEPDALASGPGSLASSGA